MSRKSLSELMTIPDFQDRIEYLKTGNMVGTESFGGHRYLNQMLYSDPEWKRIRAKIMDRDSIDGYVMDLCHPDHPILDKVYIHHINPITVEDIANRNSCVFDPENLISTSFDTHNEIHYYARGKRRRFEFVERKPFDTCPWRN